MKVNSSWHSPRLEREVQVVRWGTYGAPVLIFPTAGGDAEEIERFLMIRALKDLLDAGKIKVYSCDSVGGRALVESEGTPQHRMKMTNLFHSFVYRELVPAIRTDCQTDDIEIIAAGASIGAFNALGVTCRYPDVFRMAICLSGTYNLGKFLKAKTTEDLYFSSPLHFLPGLEGKPLEQLRKRFILLASGEGDYEDIGESWRAAEILGEKGIPNRVDPWGPDWHHDWVTWRAMLPKYLAELA